MQIINPPQPEVKHLSHLIEDNWDAILHEIGQTSRFVAASLKEVDSIRVSNNPPEVHFIVGDWRARASLHTELTVRITAKALVKIGAPENVAVQFTAPRTIHYSRINPLQPGKQERTPKHALRRFPYSEMLKRPEWQRCRLENFNRAHWRCQRCGDINSQLHLHHLRYDKTRLPWEYPASNLQVLCETCHLNRHGKPI